MSHILRITVLGSGTSTGVPLIGCECRVCRSRDPRNNRLRSSIFIEANDARGVTSHLLVDTSPDFRYQALRQNIQSIDAVLYTHAHADHIFGFDDLRAFNFRGADSIPAYGSSDCLDELRRLFSYALSERHRCEGGMPPKLTLHEVQPPAPFHVGSIEILPLALYHGTRPVLGFRIGAFAYLTDCSSIPDETLKLLDGLDCLIIDGLRYRDSRTHFTISEAVKEIERIAPRRAFMIHMSHDVDHEEGNRYIESLTNRDVSLSYDGLVIEVP